MCDGEILVSFLCARRFLAGAFHFAGARHGGHVAGEPSGKNLLWRPIVDSLQIDCRSLYFTMTQKSHLAATVHPALEVRGAPVGDKDIAGSRHGHGVRTVLPDRGRILRSNSRAHGGDSTEQVSMRLFVLTLAASALVQPALAHAHSRAHHRHDALSEAGRGSGAIHARRHVAYAATRRHARAALQEGWAMPGTTAVGEAGWRGFDDRQAEYRPYAAPYG